MTVIKMAFLTKQSKNQKKLLEKMDQECWKTQAIIEVNQTLGVMGNDQLGALGGVLEHVCILQSL